jgi:uncharacterized protein
LQQLCEELGGDQHAVAVGTDLAVPEDRARLAARIDELGAHVDVEAVVDLTLRYLPGMVERGRGAIITLGSGSA